MLQDCGDDASFDLPEGLSSQVLTAGQDLGNLLQVLFSSEDQSLYLVHMPLVAT